jgi:hypothetical protein
MSNLTTADATLLSGASGISSLSVIVLAAAALVAYAWYGFSVADQPYPGFPLIGKEDVKTTQEAKLKWLRSAKSIIYETLARVSRKEFFVLHLC